MPDVIKFAVVVDNEVVSNIVYPNEQPFDGVIAILRSGPVYVEVADDVQVGSTWDGQGFTPPTNG